MQARESSGNPNAIGKAGEIGLFQVKPETAAMYGVDPGLLTHPEVNRFVAKRYLGDLIKRFNGDITKAVEAYNEGPTKRAKGVVVPSTAAYASKILGTPIASTTPTVSPTPLGLGGNAKPSIGTQSLPADFGISNSNVKEIPSRLSGQGNMLELPSRNQPASSRVSGLLGTQPAYADEPYTGPTLDAPPSVATSKPYSGPQIDKPQAPLAVKIFDWAPTAGQLGGDVGGAMLGAMAPGANLSGVPEYLGAVAGGAGGSALGAVVANEVRKQYGLSPISVGKEAAYGAAGSAVGGVVPFIPRLRKAISVAKNAGMGYGEALSKATQIGSELEKQLGMGAKTAKSLENAPAAPVQQAYTGTREAGLDQIAKQIKTAPTSADRDTAMRAYQRQIDRFAPATKGVEQAFTAPGAAEAILNAKAGDTGRVLQVINQMKALKQMAPLRKALSTRIYQKAAADQAASPIKQIDRFAAAVKSVKPDVFDAVYGKNAQSRWLSTLKALNARDRDLLRHPEEAEALRAEVAKYLNEPGMSKRLSGRLGHHLFWDALIFGAVLHRPVEMAAGAGVLLGIKAFEIMSHSPHAVWLLQKAATETNYKVAARIFVAAISASLRDIGEGKPSEDESK